MMTHDRQGGGPTCDIEFHANLCESLRSSIADAMGHLTESGCDQRAVSAAFATIEISPELVQACGIFEPRSYERIELARCEAWVLLAMFWDDTKTCIHDHCESDCGFRVVRGELEETRFAKVAEQDGVVREVARRRLREGQIVSSNRCAIHRLGTVAQLSSGEVPETPQAISVHAYCPVLEREDMCEYRESS